MSVKRSFATHLIPRIATQLRCSRNHPNIRNPLIYCVNRYCLRSASVGAKRTSTGCSAPHIWRVPSSKALSCKHEQLFDLLTLVSLIIAFLEKQASKKDRLKTNLRCDERKLPVRMDVSALQPDKIFDKINEAAPNNKE